jgi:putative ABC transport system ATP-binding protein
MSERATGDVLLTDVALRRGGRTILDGVTARIRAGEATAVVGPSGAGKSTLLAVIAGIEPADSGEVVNPHPLERTGVVLQSYGLVRLLTAAENVELAIQGGGTPREEVRDRAAAELERFGLGHLADRRTDELSGGQQQRLAIARALVIRPDLLIADELTSELDPRNRERTLEQILGLRSEGVTVVLATHDAAVAARCDHVVEVGRVEVAVESEAGRALAAQSAEREQRRRIRAQEEVVRREQERLADLRAALERLVRARDGQDP